jgi:hypothetical protein
MTTLYTTYDKKWDHGRISAHVFPCPVDAGWAWNDVEDLPHVILSTPWRNTDEWRANLWFWCSHCCSAEAETVGVDEGINLLVAPEEERLKYRRKKHKKRLKRRIRV